MGENVEEKKKKVRKSEEYKTEDSLNEAKRKGYGRYSQWLLKERLDFVL